MKTDSNPARKSLFCRLCFRSLQVKRPQALLAGVSLLVGAALCSLLLNLYGGVNRGMTQSFSSFGANAVLAPRQTAAVHGALAGVMPEPGGPGGVEGRFPQLEPLPVLYSVTRLQNAVPDPRMPAGEQVLAVGTHLAGLLRMNSNWRVSRASGTLGDADCLVGVHLAAEMGFHTGSRILLHSLSPERSNAAPAAFKVAGIVSTGASADDQVFVPLGALQQLDGLTGKVSLVELRAPGDASEIEASLGQLATAFPELDVRPVRQIVYAEGKVLSTIRHLTLALTALILAIIFLCVAATMSAIVLERRKDVAVMKALGASDGLVMKLFMSEAALLGFAGGLIGFFAGAWLARPLAVRLFAVDLAPTWWVLPAVLVSSTILAVIATMFPVRVVRGIQPAVTLKGA